MQASSFDMPDNWSELAPYVIAGKEDVVRHIIGAEKCFFYDTCAFWNHAGITDPTPIFDYIKYQKGIVVLTKMILAELCSGNQKLWEEHIQYVQKMKQHGISVLVIAEEDVFTVLGSCYSGTMQVNQMFSNAIKYTKSKTGSVEDVLLKNKTLKKEIMSSSGSKDSSLTERFFEEVKRNKLPGDNLGEELLAICLHMLANIPGCEVYKYIVLTDDYVAMKLFGKVKENVQKHIGRRCISGVTTAKLCWLMVNSGILLDVNGVIDIISSGHRDKQLRVYSSEQYELAPSEKTMTIEEFSEKIVNESGVKIYL